MILVPSIAMMISHLMFVAPGEPWQLLESAPKLGHCAGAAAVGAGRMGRLSSATKIGMTWDLMNIFYIYIYRYV